MSDVAWTDRFCVVSIRDAAIGGRVVGSTYFMLLQPPTDGRWLWPSFEKKPYLMASALVRLSVRPFSLPRSSTLPNSRVPSEMYWQLLTTLLTEPYVVGCFHPSLLLVSVSVCIMTVRTREGTDTHAEDQ